MNSDDLLRQAAAADRSARVELFRDRIAVQGGRAIERVRLWLTDPSLDAFAVVIIEHAARRGALTEARAALKAGLPLARQPIVPHIKAALERIGVAPSPRAPRSSVGPGYVPRPEAALSELGELVAGWETEGRPRQPGVP